MKKGDLRRGQILDTAEKLFFEKGYDRTSIQDILDALKLSKGGFYHYFDAKETVLREICERRWVGRYDRLCAEQRAGRRGAVDKLNQILLQASLFEAEDVKFAALLTKLCYRDRDASIRDYRRRVLIDRLSPQLDDVILEGIQSGQLHARQPMGLGRLLLLLACDVNDEICEIFIASQENPDLLAAAVELLNTYREGVELLCGAPFGTVLLLNVTQTVNTWREITEEYARLEANER